MKKQGFTLMELLITLGIVGVVSALTIPALVTSTRNKGNAAKLSSAVLNLENGFTNAIAQEGADNLYGTNMWSEDRINATEGDKDLFAERIGQYLRLSGYENSDNDFYGTSQTCAMSASGSTNKNACSASGQRFGGSGQMFTLKTIDGVAVHIRTYKHTNDEIATQKAAAISEGCSYYTNAADIVIDVNGKDSPNTFGRDIFWFEVGENGTLYPNGSKDVARVEPQQGRWDEASVAACNNASKGSEEGLRGIGCAGRVVADGYKINY